MVNGPGILQLALKDVKNVLLREFAMIHPRKQSPLASCHDICVDLHPPTPWLDPAVDRFGQGMGCASYQKHLSGPCPTKKCVFGSPHQPKSIQILDTVGAKLCHLSWRNKLDQVLWGCDFLPHQLCASVHTPPNSLFPRIWTNYNDNESLVTWLHHVTSHFFLYLPPQWNSQWNSLSKKCPSLLRWLRVANPWPWMKRQPEKNDWMILDVVSSSIYSEVGYCCISWLY